MGMKLYVRNLPWKVSDDDLREWVEKNGYTCLRAEVILERETGRSRGFGFLHFETEAAAEEVRVELNGVQLDGRPIYLEVATERERGRGERSRRDDRDRRSRRGRSDDRGW